MTAPFDDSEEPPPVGARDLLTDDEALVGHACLRLLPLLERLGERPFDRRLYAELQDYLTTTGWEAATAFERLQEMGPEHLTARLSILRGLGGGAE